jgi:hypothetical protein
MSVLVGRLLLATALLGTVGSTLWNYPHQLAYFNELAGGPYNGWRHLLGSSLDWGQDVVGLGELARLDNLTTGDRQIAAAVATSYGIDYLGLSQFTTCTAAAVEAASAIPRQIDRRVAVGFELIVSINCLFGEGCRLPGDRIGRALHSKQRSPPPEFVNGVAVPVTPTLYRFSTASARE